MTAVSSVALMRMTSFLKLGSSECFFPNFLESFPDTLSALTTILITLTGL